MFSCHNNAYIKKEPSPLDLIKYIKYVQNMVLPYQMSK